MSEKHVQFDLSNWRKQMKTYIGVDLHRTNFTVCVRTNGKEKSEL